MRTLATETHMTMIVVTHEMGFAREVGTSLALFHDGLIVEQGPPREVCADPQHPPTRQFLQAVL